MIKSIKASDA